MSGIGTAGYEGVTGRLTCDDFGDCGIARFNIVRLDDPNAGQEGLLSNVMYSHTVNRPAQLGVSKCLPLAFCPFYCNRGKSLRKSYIWTVDSRQLLTEHLALQSSGSILKRTLSP